MNCPRLDPVGPCRIGLAKRLPPNPDHSPTLLLHPGWFCGFLGGWSE